MGKIQRDRQVRRPVKSDVTIADTLVKNKLTIAADKSREQISSQISTISKPKSFKKNLAKVTAVQKPAAHRTIESASTASFEKHVSKKNKLKQRKDKFKRKIDVLRNAKKQVAELKKVKKQKQKKTIKASNDVVRSTISAAADMSAMIDALPTLDDSLPSLNSLFRLKGKDVKSGIRQFDEAAAKKKAQLRSSDGVIKKTSKKTRILENKNEFMKRYHYFQKLSADKEFKKNPREVIAMHIRNQRLQ